MAQSEMSRAIRSLETTKNAKKILQSFYTRGELRRGSDRPLAWCMHGVPPEILEAFELEWEWPENFGTLCAAKGVATKFIEEAEAEGYGVELCSYLLNTMGYLRKYSECGEVPPEAPLSGMGNPTLLLGSGMTCDPRYKWFQAIATRYIDIPSYFLDPLSPPYGINVHDPKVREHYLNQMREDTKAFIEFLEKNLKKKLDYERFKEVVAKSQQAERLWYETLELNQNVPAPMGAEDYFTAIIPQMYMLGTDEALTFYTLLKAEVEERVKQGIGVISKEKYRFMWMGLPPWFNLGLFNYLESLGAIIPIVSTYYVGKPYEWDPEEPIEALVQRTWQKAVWYHDRRNEAVAEICNQAIAASSITTGVVEDWVKKYHLDGAIMHRSKSCRALSIGQVYYKEVLKDMGIKSLIFESDMADPRAWSDAKIKGLIEAFLESIGK